MIAKVLKKLTNSIEAKLVRMTNTCEKMFLRKYLNNLIEIKNFVLLNFFSF